MSSCQENLKDKTKMSFTSDGDSVHDNLGMYGSWWFIFSFKRLFNLIRLGCILLNNVYAISAYFFWMTLCLPVRFYDSGRIYFAIEERLFGFLLTQVGCWNFTAGYDISESGDRLEEIWNEPFLFMPNHQSTADVPFCMTIFSNRTNGSDKVMWIMDRIFKYTNFGCVAWNHDDFFILAGKGNREKSLVDLKTHLKSVFIPKQRKYLVLFPEGGFLRKRKTISNEFAKKNDLPQLEHVTLPRTGALEVILDILGRPKNNNNGISQTATPKISKIVDVTIAYPEGKPLDLIAILFAHRPPCVTHVHYRVFDVKDIPSDSDGIKKWMYNLYIEKEQLLSKFYESGVWPYDLLDRNAKPPKKLIHDPIFFICLHLASIASFYLLYITLQYVYKGLFYF